MKISRRKTLVIIIVVIVLVILFKTTLQIFPVIGDSMEPGLQWGQQLLTNKTAYHFHEPERGDVIILRPPFNPEVGFIKRLIAVPGDTVEVKDGAVYINGLKLSEPYIKEPPTYTFPPQKIPDDEYFVLGDNRNDAFDSHVGWTAPRQDIIGKVWLSVWPPGQWEVVSHYPLQEQLVSPAE